jgi:hypothetical protein
LGLLIIAWNMMRGLQGGIEKYSKIYRDEIEREEKKGLLQEAQDEIPPENGPEGGAGQQPPEVVANQ